MFVVAIGMLGEASGIGALLSGFILLLLAVLAPWACFKVLDFAGTQVAGEWHRATNGSTLAAVHQGRVSVQSLMRTVAPIVGGATGGPGGAAAGAAAGSAGSGASRSGPPPIAVTSRSWSAVSGPTTAPRPIEQSNAPAQPERPA